VILALDTSGDELVVAVVEAGGLLAGATRGGGRHQAQVVDAVAEALAAAGIGARDIEALAVATGPGSHTGLRVGLSTVSGLAYPRRLRIHPLSSLAVAAHRAADGAAEVLAVVPAGRGRVHVQLYRREAGAWAATMDRRHGDYAAVTAGIAAPVAGEPAVLAAAAAAGLAVAPHQDGPAALAAVTSQAVRFGKALAYDQLRGQYE